MTQAQIKNIFFAFGIVAILVMLLTFEVSFPELYAYIRQAGYWLIAILLLWGVLYMMNAWAWHVIIRGSGDCPVSFFYLLKLTVSGFALNYTTPIGLLGGEPYKIMEMTSHIGVQRATSSVVLFAMMHVFAHLCFWASSVILYIMLAAHGLLPMNTAIALVLLFMVTFCAGGIYLFIRGYRHGMVVKLIHLVGRVPGLRDWTSRLEAAHKDDLIKIDRQIAEMHTQSRTTFYGSLLIEYIGRVCQSLEILFMLILFGIDEGRCFSDHLIAFAHSFLILSFTSLFANLLGFLPLQLGGREGGFALSVSALGMTGALGMFISIICRVRELFWAVIGIALMKVKPSKIKLT